MTSEIAYRTEELTLLNAVLKWCDPGLVEAVKSAERHQTQYKLQSFSRPTLTPPNEWQSLVRQEFLGGQDTSSLIAAWRILENHLRRKLEDDELFLAAVLSGAADAEPQRVSGAFAAEFIFDFNKSTIKQGKQTFLRVRVSQQAATVRDAIAPPVLSLDTVRHLDPDVVAALLELHAEHVCRDLRVALNQPGKASVLALAATKMRTRANVPELRPTLVEEAEWLEAWCAKVAPSYQALGAKTISNKLGALYRDLRPAAHAPK